MSGDDRGGYRIRRDGGQRRVAGTVLRIGRGTNADVRFEDPSVALEHARVERRRDGWFLLDLGSVTGTYLDGRPVSEERLADGAVIDVGEHRLRAGMPAPEGPLELTVEAAAAGGPPVDAGTPAARGAATPAGPAVTAPEIDYLAAYRLDGVRLAGGRLTKAAIALGALLLALLAVLWVLAAGRSEDFRPGALSAAHTGVVAAADCFACHAPWRGAMDANCTECHAPERIAHQAVQAATPACRSCHNEHQGQERISVVADRDCVACHGDLEAAPGGAARFAKAVSSFADHPPFSVTVSRDGAAGRVPASRAVDPTALKLNHALHLKPGLLGPEGRETLTCADCHELETAEAVAEGAMPDLAAISYEQHCQRCHLLNFDAALPPAPHLPPAELGNFLLGAYRGDRERVTSVGQRRRDVTRGLTGLSRAERRALEERARRAEYDLYRNHCVICHQVDLEATPVPAVTPPQVPADWLPHARFSHATHLQFTQKECADCHPGATRSKATADLLLPAIEGCLECHGGGGGAGGGDGGAARAGAASRCIDCHGYHAAARNLPPG